VSSQAIWTATTFGAKQGAAFTFANAPISGSSLILKASGGPPSVPSSPQNFIRVRYAAGSIRVEVTTDYGVSYTSLGQFTATPVSGNTLTAQGNADGSVDVWLNSAYLGHSSTSSLGAGRIGIQLPAGARIDDFRGGTVP
jgi:hypothetical protein